MVAYYFVAATLIAVIPILVVFKITIERIRQNPDELKQLFQKFILSIAVIDMLPILFTILGFVHLEPGYDIADVVTPTLIVMVTYIVAVVFIFIQRINDIEIDTSAFRRMSLSFITPFPLIALIGFWMMIN